MLRIKPHKGLLINWYKYNVPPKGYVYFGIFKGHPEFDGRHGHTSAVLAEFPQEDGSIEIATRNSRYTLAPLT